MNKLEGADQYILSFCQDHEEGSKKKKSLTCNKNESNKDMECESSQIRDLSLGTAIKLGSAI